MSWWLATSIVGVIAAGVLAGVLISVIISKRKNKNFHLPFKHHLQVVGSGQIEPVAIIKDPLISPSNELRHDLEAAQENSAPSAQKQTEVYFHTRNLEPPLAMPSVAVQSAALLEIEANLSIATRYPSAKPVLFQTDVWNTRRSDFNPLGMDLLRQVTEAYVDMLLANDVVWLINEMGRDSLDLKNSHLKLKNKIAERLQKIMPDIRMAFRQQQLNSQF